MAITRQGGPGIGLDTKPLIGNNNVMSLPAGATYVLPPGQFYVTLGSYTLLQSKDPISGKWRGVQTLGNDGFISTDGANIRIANLTGCALGALITNVGSAYTSAPAVTASAGNSVWTAIVGGAINSTVTVTTAGLGYTNPPSLQIQAPPAGGIQATAVAVVSAGAISSVTVTNQGAGYPFVPLITVTPDPRDTITTPAVLTVNATLAGSGTITGLLCTDHGQAVTAVPTLTFTGGGGSAAAATAVMCFTATGLTVGTAGAGYGNAQPFAVITTGGIVPGTAGATINPEFDKSILTPRQANISGTSTSGGAITATGAIINDGGLFQAVPSGIVLAGGSGLATGQGVVTITVGGVTDTSIIQPF